MPESVDKERRAGYQEHGRQREEEGWCGAGAAGGRDGGSVVDLQVPVLMFPASSSASSVKRLMPGERERVLLKLPPVEMRVPSR
jgi:hypothetical protein